jgi:hypothetical protein
MTTPWHLIPFLLLMAMLWALGAWEGMRTGRAKLVVTYQRNNEPYRFWLTILLLALISALSAYFAITAALQFSLK